MTSILERIERLLVTLIEAPVERLFRRPLHPVHLARRLEQAMVDTVLVGAGGPVAPSYFAVRLDPATYARFEGAREGIERDLELHLTRAARDRELRYLQSPEVELRCDPAMPPGRFKVETAFGAGSNAGDPGAAPEATMAMPLGPAVPAVEVRTRDGGRRTVWLKRHTCTVGRAPTNDLVLADPAVSRHHAVLSWDGARLTIEDAGSVNGLTVNGTRTRHAALEDGDSIAIGNCELVIRRE